jgi:hypothetical protein
MKTVKYAEIEPLKNSILITKEPDQRWMYYDVSFNEKDNFYAAAMLFQVGHARYRCITSIRNKTKNHPEVDVYIESMVMGINYMVVGDFNQLSGMRNFIWVPRRSCPKSRYVDTMARKTLRKKVELDYTFNGSILGQKNLWCEHFDPKSKRYLRA